MFCKQCENILNLDILLSTHEKYASKSGKSRPYPHHETFAALEQAAADGCEICRMVTEAPPWKIKEMKSSACSKSGDLHIYFQFVPNDNLEFCTVRTDCGDSTATQPDPASLLSIRISPMEGDVVTNLMDGVFVTRPLAEDTGSEECFELANKWLKTCLKTHHRCRTSEAPLPTRVIDVGGLNDDFVSLHISYGRLGEWLTLSHCWGKHPPAITTTDNLDARCSGFAVSSLPNTFQDAITITRKLGYRFLWIDSLCIIQDSKPDWQAESVKMNEIYARGVLNISADAATDNRQGIFESAKMRVLEGHQDLDGWIMKPRLTHLPVHSSDRGIRTTLYAYVYQGDVRPDSASPLQTRAWVFQEAALSPRRLRYTYHGMTWNCTSVNFSCNEKEPQEINNLDWHEDYVFSIYDIPHQPLPPRYVLGQAPAAGFQAIAWWYKQVNDYANRRITYFSDRFPAFSGVAKEFAQRTGYTFKAGIWLQDFRRGLLWQSCERAIHHDVGPSWSWVVVAGGAGHGDVYERDALREYIDSPDEAELVDVVVENDDSNIYGQVTSARLVLRGRCYKLRDLLESREFHYQSERFLFKDKNHVRLPNGTLPAPGSIPISVDLIDDAKKDIWQQDDIILIKIAKFAGQSIRWNGPARSSETSESMFCLILEPVRGAQDTYRRIGMTRLADDGSTRKDWETRIVTLC